MKTFVIICLIAVSAFLLGCKTSMPVGEQALVEQDPVEGMVFLAFRMRSDSLSGTEINLISKIVVPQKQKSDPVSAETPDRLVISQTDHAGNVLSVTAVDHPLLRKVEFADDEGRFQSRKLTLKEAEVGVRVTLYRETEYIRVEEELNGKTAYTAKFKLRD